MTKGKGRIIPRGDSLTVDFHYKGVRYRPALRGLSSSKKAHIKTAEEMLTRIQADIVTGTFNFADYFPDHPKAKLFRKGSDITIEEKLKQWDIIKTKQKARTTMRGYRVSVYTYLIPQFGSIYLSDLTTTQVKEWIYELQCHLSNKTINNHLIPLREIYREAYLDELIDKNPLERIKNLSFETPEVYPFTVQELQTILNVCEGQIRNLFQFAFWTGCRTGEYIALKWDDVNLKERTAYIRHTRNRSGDKTTPKTKAGIRKLELTKPACQALENQLNYTNKGQVFLNPYTNKPWVDDAPVRRRGWIPALKAAEIEYRKPYSTRHTYASMMLSAGMQPMWVVSQMGHTNLSQIISTYGKWIPTPENHLDDKVSYLLSQKGT